MRVEAVEASRPRGFEAAAFHPALTRTPTWGRVTV